MPHKDSEQIRAQTRAYNAAYRATHMEEIVARQSAYRATHREKLREDAKTYYYSHRETRLTFQKAYQETHKEDVAVYKARHYKQHRKDIIMRVLTWAKNNPEMMRERNMRRRAAKLRVVTEKINYREIMKRDHMACGICRRGVKMRDLSFDHIIPLSVGGPHTNNNLRVTHRSCNLRRGPGRIPAQIRMAL